MWWECLVSIKGVEEWLVCPRKILATLETAKLRSRVVTEIEQIEWIF